MRTTTMPAALSAAATALACAALLTATGCGLAKGSGAAAKASPTASATPPDPLAGRDPAAVLRAAYEETAKTEKKNAIVSRTIGDREMSAGLTFEGESDCWGKVTVMRAGAGEILMEGGRLSFRGDEGFLKDQFRDTPPKSPDTDQGWIDARTSDPSVAHLRALCAAARPDPAELTDVRREPDTYQNGKPVAVFKAKTAGGAEITDHVLLDGVPYLSKHWHQSANDHGRVEYDGVRPAGAVSQPAPTLGT
ncbi:hypothetical protein [Streptomyces sp. C]|uniref:hypothetical protein n=1 Tax=Streptomyces sp. C TaxID=253839 RepID=UPI0001B56229|nr:hypothetical protein [Streptomyces sp. C]EFL15588.1 predicted protein [Streptomyces sp. C]